MNVFILSLSGYIYSTNRIFKEAKKRGHKVSIIDHTKCSIRLNNGKKEIIFEGDNIINEPDIIIPRIGTSVNKHGSTIVKEFEMNGVYSTASSQGIACSHSKVQTLQLLNDKKLPIPNTIYSVNKDNVSEQIDFLGGAPLIIKIQDGTQGVGVMLAESKKSAKSIIDTFYGLHTSILLQEYIKESNSEDIRVFVVGDKVVSSMKRKGKDDDFRSNIHKGGSGVKANLTEEEQRIAVKAAHYLGLPVAGVDLIRSNRGPLVLEVNSTPGLQGIEAYTKINVAEEIIKYLEYKCSNKISKIKR
ncbi:RimK family alpha-L-glutamate ligase [Tenacibaculum sp. IB213877]|uniref:RimK family alpha-L-glutamate ligase n=1 Tax=Tenacibaculum sp. IB213877 TaxID=3097351 RepID=UPI002A5A5696|nr:RimK family alpha-L-glutamate ligase [Tenacibaculum sp. IB213877]MDY0780604.1 RimK family alpha-L-glutamate ligase [Tenacibaculum sp. IB213877]